MEKSNVNTGKLVSLFGLFIQKYDYFPTKWYDFLDIQSQFNNDEMTVEEFSFWVDEALNDMILLQTFLVD
jgi:hypothetical protein